MIGCAVNRRKEHEKKIKIIIYSGVLLEYNHFEKKIIKIFILIMLNEDENKSSIRIFYRLFRERYKCIVNYSDLFIVIKLKHIL